jgi:hypothetical protein
MIAQDRIPLIVRKFTWILQREFFKRTTKVIVAKANMATIAKETEKIKRRGIQLDLQL